jgi:hypothetical protein
LQAAFYHGNYGFFGGVHSRVARVDLSSFSTSDISVITLASHFSGTTNKRIIKMSHDGVYAYFSDNDSGKILRLLLSGPFTDAAVELAYQLPTSMYESGWSGLTTYRSWGYVRSFKSSSPIHHKVVRFPVANGPYEASHFSNGY